MSSTNACNPDISALVAQLPHEEDVDLAACLVKGNLPPAAFRGNREQPASTRLDRKQASALRLAFTRSLDAAHESDYESRTLPNMLVRCVGRMGSERDLMSIYDEWQNHFSSCDTESAIRCRDELLMEICGAMMSIGGPNQMDFLLDIASDTKLTMTVRREANDCYQELLSMGVYDATRMPRSSVFASYVSDELRIGEPNFGAAALSTSPSKQQAIRVVRRLSGSSSRFESLLKSCVR